MGPDTSSCRRESGTCERWYVVPWSALRGGGSERLEQLDQLVVGAAHEAQSQAVSARRKLENLAGRVSSVRKRSLGIGANAVCNQSERRKTAVVEHRRFEGGR